MKKLILCIVFNFICCSFCSASGIELVLEPNPQTNTDTCQSYALAFVLALGSPEFSDAQTAKGLRALEKRIRLDIDQVAKERGQSIYSHLVWREVVKRVTSGKSQLKMEYINISEPSYFYQRIYEITGINNAGQLGAMLSSMVVKTPVITSVQAIEGSNYATGHIVTVLGLGEIVNPLQSIPANTVDMLVLNSAVKTKGVRVNMCHPDFELGDYRYQGSAFMAKQYQLKIFTGGKYLLMYLQ